MKITAEIITATAKKIYDYKNAPQKSQFNNEAFNTVKEYGKQINLAIDKVKETPKEDTNTLIDRISDVMFNYYLMKEKNIKKEAEFLDSQEKYFDIITEHTPEVKLASDRFNSLKEEFDEMSTTLTEFEKKIENDLELSDGAVNTCFEHTENQIKYEAINREKEKAKAEQERAQYVKDNTISFDESYLESFVSFAGDYRRYNEDGKSFKDFSKEALKIRKEQLELDDGSNKDALDYLKAEDKKACLGMYPKLQHDYDKKNWFVKLFSFSDRKQLKEIKNKLNGYGVDDNQLKQYKDYVEKRFDLDNTDFSKEDITMPEVFTNKEKVVDNKLENEQLSMDLGKETDMMPKNELGKGFDSPSKNEPSKDINISNK